MIPQSGIVSRGAFSGQLLLSTTLLEWPDKGGLYREDPEKASFSCGIYPKALPFSQHLDTIFLMENHSMTGWGFLLYVKSLDERTSISSFSGVQNTDQLNTGKLSKDSFRDC
ncbi:MAG: hypothetical protein ACLFR1_05760 [Spirochaetia bacterium]